MFFKELSNSVKWLNPKPWFEGLNLCIWICIAIGGLLIICVFSAVRIIWGAVRGLRRFEARVLAAFLMSLMFLNKKGGDVGAARNTWHLFSRVTVRICCAACLPSLEELVSQGQVGGWPCVGLGRCGWRQSRVCVWNVFIFNCSEDWQTSQLSQICPPVLVVLAVCR